MQTKLQVIIFLTAFGHNRLNMVAAVKLLADLPCASHESVTGCYCESKSTAVNLPAGIWLVKHRCEKYNFNNIFKKAFQLGVPVSCTWFICIFFYHRYFDFWQFQLMSPIIADVMSPNTSIVLC